MDRRSRVVTDIDFEKQGKQHGFLSVPHSTHESAYGRIQIPIVCVNNGPGPTILLVAGNHGDEYEGQVALQRLARDLKPDNISGRAIILPALNFPAVEAGRRVSPLDDGNLNRLFPGDPDGGPTAMIAHYVEAKLLPLASHAIDLHSGGTSLVYLPCVLARNCGPDERVVQTFAMLQAFGAPLAYVTDGRAGGGERTFHAAAERCGVIVITTELGGGGTLDPEGLDLAELGIRRAMHQIGMLPDKPPAPRSPTRLTHVPDLQFYVFAQAQGIFEPAARLGDEVSRQQLAGYLHYADTPWRDPQPAYFREAGVVICRRALGSTRPGDCLYQIAADYEPKRKLV
jgi:predicted deacylase